MVLTPCGPTWELSVGSTLTGVGWHVTTRSLWVRNDLQSLSAQALPSGAGLKAELCLPGTAGCSLCIQGGWPQAAHDGSGKWLSPAKAIWSI